MARTAATTSSMPMSPPSWAHRQPPSSSSSAGPRTWCTTSGRRLEEWRGTSSAGSASTASSSRSRPGARPPTRPRPSSSGTLGWASLTPWVALLCSSKRAMWTLRSRSARRKRRLSRSRRASVSAANRSHGRMMANGQRVAGRPICRLFGSLLELCDELLDLEPQSLEGGEELRLELALELLALFEEILHQVAEPVCQLPPSGNASDLWFAGVGFLGQLVHLHASSRWTIGLGRNGAVPPLPQRLEVIRPWGRLGFKVGALSHKVAL